MFAWPIQENLLALLLKRHFDVRFVGLFVDIRELNANRPINDVAVGFTRPLSSQ